MDRDVAHPPQPVNVHAGSAEASVKEKVGREGARTVPGRPEHGGNCDIKNLSRGSKVYLPVHVPGAKFSVGDLHFSQGDGEISFCGAIEMAGVITIKFNVMKGGVAQLGMKSPIYVPGPVEPSFGPGRYIYFEGFSVDEHGKQRESLLSFLFCLVMVVLTKIRNRLPRRHGRIPPDDAPLHRVPAPLRLRRLPGLLAAVVCANPGPHRGHGRRGFPLSSVVDRGDADLTMTDSQCMHHAGLAHRHLRLRHLAERRGAEARPGQVRQDIVLRPEHMDERVT